MCWFISFLVENTELHCLHTHFLSGFCFRGFDELGFVTGLLEAIYFALQVFEQNLPEPYIWLCSFPHQSQGLSLYCSATFLYFYR